MEVKKPESPYFDIDDDIDEDNLDNMCDEELLKAVEAKFLLWSLKTPLMGILEAN